MNRKPRNLSAEDRRAVDLLMDQGAAHRPAVTAVSAGVPHRRVSAASKLLAVLDTLPAIDPPADLVARTMNRIAAAESRPLVAQPTLVPAAMLH